MYMSYRPVISYDLAHRTYTYRVRDVTQWTKKSYQVWRITSMADINIDAVRKQKKAEYNKQYRLKRKLLLQQQASKDIYMIRYFHP
jgi:hypothetical protein